MEQLDAASMIFLVTLITQFIKKHWTPADEYAQLVALGLSFFIIWPFYLIPGIRVGLEADTLALVWEIFQSVIWTLFGWLASIGVYQVGIKTRGVINAQSN